MNRGIFGFPRSGALDARRVTAQRISATESIRTPGASPTSTGIKLADESDLGLLFRPASYTAVDTVSVTNGGGFGSANCATNLSASVTGNQLNLSLSANCNCNCAGDCSNCGRC